MRMARHKLLDPSRELSLCGLAYLETKAAQDPAQAVLHVAKLRLHKLARRQQRSGLLRAHRFAVHRTKPAQPHQLRNPARIVAIRLHWHRLQRLAHVPRLQQFDRPPRFSQRPKKPLRQGAGLQPDPLKVKAGRAEPGDQRLRLAGHLGLSQNLAVCVNNTHLSIPMTRRFRHNSPWSSLLDAWSEAHPSDSVTPSM